MNTVPKLLSKTKLMRGYRCLKCIYLTIHHPEKEAPVTPDTEALFKQGHEVGAKAREYYPGGTLIDNLPWDFRGSLAKTRALLANGTPVLYEAAFEYAGCYARTDIIRFSPETKKWSIYEVKSSTKVKPEHYDDVGLQTWIAAKSGLPIEKICLVHLNPDCQYPDLSNLFKEVDITGEIRNRYLSIQPEIHKIVSTIQQPTVPDIDIGSYCLHPTTCGFTQHCWEEKHIPEMSIFNLPGIKERKWELYYDGMITLDDPHLSELNDLQERVVECFKTGKRYINPDPIRKALSEWDFPLVLLDFETINPPIPRYNGCRPYGQVPFQFSVHICPTLTEEPAHLEFLQDSREDPRPALIPKLIEACGESGSIVAYHAPFEQARIKELADHAPAYREPLLKLLERFVDPLPVIKQHVYDNQFGGSFSLKAVVPALLGKQHAYNNMMVGNGSEAQRAFEEFIAPDTPDIRRSALKNALIEYCKKDTLVLLELVKWLYVTSGSGKT